MIQADEDALICDLAEVYNIYDYKQLPASKVAAFSLGLKENSRIKMKMSNTKIEFETILLAGLFDKVSLLLYSKTKDAEKGLNRPESVVEMLMGKHKQESNMLVFKSGKEFDATRKQLLRGDG